MNARSARPLPSPRSKLYPEIEPAETGRLALDDMHEMYWEVSGNPAGVPAVFLHGGPGAGTSPAHRRFFDPAHYRIVLYDQRGAGRSTPAGELARNTTQHLIDDLGSGLITSNRRWRRGRRRRRS